MDDYLIRAVGARDQVRAFIAITTGVVDEARRRHDTWPVATAALGRTLTAGLLLGASLKGEDILSIRFLGDGPLGGIIVTADAQGRVRGYVQEPQVDIPLAGPGKLAVGAAVGKGFLHVTRDLGLKEPFTGSVELVSGEIAEDLAHYLTVSEQSPSAVALGVRVEPGGRVAAAGGILITILPGADEESIQVIENNMHLIAEGKGPEEILAIVMNGLSPRVLSQTPVAFRCKCDRERVEAMLVGMGREDLETMVRESEPVTVTCHFCGEAYRFGDDDLATILSRLE